MHSQLKELPFEEKHLDAIVTNEFSDFEQHRSIIMLPNTLKFTLAKRGVVVCILACFQYAPDKYMGFLLASDYLTASDGKDVREFVKETFLSYNMDRLETLSVACEQIDRWHEFLGFELEGTKKRYLGDKDYNMWGLIAWE